jgi:cellulose synthase operon protein C
VKMVLAEAYMRRGQTDKSIRLYESVSGASRNATALNNLAWLYYLKRDARALDTGKKAYELAKGSPAIADTYGWILVNSGDVRRGTEVLKAAAATASTNPEIRFHYAYALAQTGDEVGSRHELQEVLRLSEKLATDPEVVRLKQQLKL